MLDGNLAEAWINTKHVVLGRRLKPFCLYYRFLLEFIESPLLTGKEATPLDLEIASRCCSVRFGDIPPTKINPVRLFWSFAGKKLSRESNAFNDYINDFYALPDFWRKDSDGPTSRGGPPDVLNIASACIQLGLFGGDEEKVWMMPIGKAHWYASTFHYHKGADIDYVTEANRKMMAELKNRIGYDGERQKHQRQRERQSQGGSSVQGGDDRTSDRRGGGDVGAGNGRFKGESGVGGDQVDRDGEGRRSRDGSDQRFGHRRGPSPSDDDQDERGSRNSPEEG